jgi:hypothetical protein
LNDPVFVEAAQGLAQRVIRETGTSAEVRIRHGFEITLARSPKPDELQWLREYFESSLSGSRSESAALGATMSVLLNLDEFITRE